ncbi:MAG: hypothetical protein ACYC7D_01495 [Nitrososphaerales archaeon]
MKNKQIIVESLTVAVVILVISLILYSSQGILVGPNIKGSGTTSLASTTTFLAGGEATTFVTGTKSQESLAAFGNITSLSSARDYVGATSTTFTLPTSLPDNLSLVQIRAKSSLAALIYEPSTIGNPLGSPNASIVILIMRDGSNYSFPFPGPYMIQGGSECNSNSSTGLTTCTTFADTTIYYSPAPVRVSVSGNLGWGYDGLLTWWSNELHYAIKGNLPLSSLLSIAQSMNT